MGRHSRQADMIGLLYTGGQSSAEKAWVRILVSDLQSNARAHSNLQVYVAESLRTVRQVSGLKPPACHCRSIVCLPGVPCYVTLGVCARVLRIKCTEKAPDCRHEWHRVGLPAWQQDHEPLPTLH